MNDSLIYRGAATFDFDHDGDLDIIAGVLKSRRAEFAKTDQKIKLFRNDSENDNNWIGFKLIGAENVNKDCIGCSITIKNSNNEIQIKEVDGGTGHSSQSSKILYFGLGKVEYAKDITIQWLGHSEMKIDDLKAGKVYKIELNKKIRKLY